MIELVDQYAQFLASDPGASAMYKMEVLRDAESKTRPVFRVTTNSGEQVSFLGGMLVCI